MPSYRRVLVPGGTCSFTVNLLERRCTLLADHVEALRESFRVAYADWPHSSFHRYVKAELLAAGWVGGIRKAG